MPKGAVADDLWLRSVTRTSACVNASSAIDQQGDTSRCNAAVACYPTGFLALTVAAGVTTGLVAIFFSRGAKPYANFLVVSQSELVHATTVLLVLGSLKHGPLDQQQEVMMWFAFCCNRVWAV